MEGFRRKKYLVCCSVLFGREVDDSSDLHRSFLYLYYRALHIDDLYLACRLWDNLRSLELGCNLYNERLYKVLSRNTRQPGTIVPGCLSLANRPSQGYSIPHDAPG